MGEASLEHVFRFDLAIGSVGIRKQTPQGGLIADANLTRTGVFTYRQADGSSRRELRHPDEVFHPDSLATYRNAPVTLDHPGRVGPDNWKTHAVGTIGSDARRNGDFVSGEIHIQHGPAMQRADAKELREVSCGYSCDVDPTPGTYQGQPYDAAQRKIRINHVAVGPQGWGRMGPETRMHLDSASGISGEEIGAADSDRYVHDRSKSTTETSTMPDDNKAALEKAQSDLTKAAADLESAKQDAANAKTEGERLAAKTREDAATIASQAAQLQLANAKVAHLEAEHASPEARQKQDSLRQAEVEELIAVRADAKYVFATVADPEAKSWKQDGKTADQIRREIVASVMPTIKLDALNADGLRATYVEAMKFKREVDKSRADAMAALTGKRMDGSEMAGDDDEEEVPDAPKARKDMVKRKRDAWKLPRKDRMKTRDAARAAR